MSNFIREFEEDEEEEEEEEEEMLPNSTLPPSSKGAFTTKNDGDNDSKLNSTVFKKKRNHPGNPDPDAEVIALSPRTLMATNRYICEVCHKGFKRDQNLQLHRRGHNLPWKLKQRPSTEIKKRVYICPVLTCIHREPSRALGDLTGIKKHFCRKHGEKKWKCDKCSKRYAVQSDWKAHSKICGTREYRCDCGTLFSRKDSFVTHRAFCDALAEENNRVNQSLGHAMGATFQSQSPESFSSSMPVTSSFASATALSISNQQPLFLNSSAGLTFSSCNSDANFNPNAARATLSGFSSSSVSRNANIAMSYPSMSATALLQKAAEMGSKISDNEISPILLRGFTGYSCSTMSSQGSVAQEASATVNHNMALTNGLHLDQNAFEKQWEPDLAVVQGGFFNSPMENGVTHDNSLGMLVSGNERTTVDFLGVGPGGQLGIGEERSCDGHTIGLSYSERQQTLRSEVQKAKLKTTTISLALSCLLCISTHKNLQHTR